VSQQTDFAKEIHQKSLFFHRQTSRMSANILLALVLSEMKKCS